MISRFFLSLPFDPQPKSQLVSQSETKIGHQFFYANSTNGLHFT